MLVGRQELIEPGMTVTQAHIALGHSTAGRPTIGRPDPIVDDPGPEPVDDPIIDPTHRCAQRPCS